MRRRIVKNARLLRKRRSYTIKEVAKVLGVHPRTIQAWKAQGLEPIDPTDKPLLFMGDQIGTFISSVSQAAKRPLMPDEFYCPRCRAARRSDPESIMLRDTGKLIGPNNRSIVVRGKCSTCGCDIYRFSSTERLSIPWLCLLAGKADESLDGFDSPAVYSVIQEDDFHVC